MTNKNKTVWSSRFKNLPSQSFQRIGASINIDKRLYEQDIFASKIHIVVAYFFQKIKSSMVILKKLKHVESSICDRAMPLP